MKERLAYIEGKHIVLRSEYNLDIINIIRDIAGREWDKFNKVWKIPASAWHAGEVLARLSGFFVVDPGIADLARGERVPPRIEYPEGLYDFQVEGLKFILRSEGRCIVADEMGLGKTIEALAYIQMDGGKTFIVSPANVVYKWRDECKRWLPGRTVYVVRTGDDDIPDVDVVIMSYAIMTLQYPRIANMPFDLGIWDEAHALKNPKAQRTRVAKAIVNSGLPKVLFLSGTPFLNEPTELFTLLNMLDPLGFRSFWEYAIRYCGAQKLDGHVFIPKGKVTNVKELTKRLDRYMIRRTKQDVTLELPELTRSYLPIDITNMAEYNRAVKDICSWLVSKGKAAKKATILTRLAYLRQIVGVGKVDAAVELAEDILETGKKVVLFAHHKEVVASLSRKLNRKDRPVLVIDGSTKQEDRQKNSNLFLMQDSEYRVMIMSVAGAEGIDMYSSSDIIFVEREWTPAKESQAEARLHRNGQKNAVTAWYIVANNTYDETMNDIVRQKREVFGQVIREDDILETVVHFLKGG